MEAGFSAAVSIYKSAILVTAV